MTKPNINTFQSVVHQSTKHPCNICTHLCVIKKNQTLNCLVPRIRQDINSL